MGEVISFRQLRRRGDKRRRSMDDYVRGQQVLADAIFHWKNDPSEEGRAAVRVLMRHLATAFRADDAPLQPRPVSVSGPGATKGETSPR